MIEQHYNLLEEPKTGLASGPFKESQYMGRLSSSALSHLSRCSHFREFRAETPIFKQGEYLDCVLVVFEGAVSSRIEIGSNGSLWLFVTGPGEIIDLGLLNNPPASPVTAQALCNVKTLAIPRQCLLQELAKEPVLEFEIMQRQKERFSLIQRLVEKQRDKSTIPFSPN